VELEYLDAQITTWIDRRTANDLFPAVARIQARIRDAFRKSGAASELFEAAADICLFARCILPVSAEQLKRNRGAS
jgi:hypothetical protein